MIKIITDARDIRTCTLAKGPTYAASAGQDSATYTTSSKSGPTGLDVSRHTRTSYAIGWGAYTAAHVTSGASIPTGTTAKVYFYARADAARTYGFDIINDPATVHPIAAGTSMAIGTTWAEYTMTCVLTLPIPSGTTYRFRAPLPDTPSGNWLELSDVRLVVVKP